MFSKYDVAFSGSSSSVWWWGRLCARSIDISPWMLTSACPGRSFRGCIIGSVLLGQLPSVHGFQHSRCPSRLRLEIALILDFQWPYLDLWLKADGQELRVPVWESYRRQIGIRVDVCTKQSAEMLLMVIASSRGGLNSGSRCFSVRYPQRPPLNFFPLSNVTISLTRTHYYVHYVFENHNAVPRTRYAGYRSMNGQSRLV